MDNKVIRHKDLSESGRWSCMPFAQQMANVGSEVFRAIKWKDKGKPDRAMSALERALELLDFTVASMQEQNRNPREILRMRELLCDYFCGKNEYASTGASLNKYFDAFSAKAALQRSTQPARAVDNSIFPINTK